MSNDDRASGTDLADRYRWTWLWSVPKYDIIRNVPPIRPDQNVYVFDRLNEKSKTRSRPAPPARCKALLGDRGILMSSATTTASSAPTIRNICLTSTHVTACTPPTMV